MKITVSNVYIICDYTCITVCPLNWAPRDWLSLLSHPCFSLSLGPFGFINRLPDCKEEARKDLFHVLGFIQGILFQENLPGPRVNSYEVSRASFPVQSVFHRRLGIQEANREDRGTWRVPQAAELNRGLVCHDSFLLPSASWPLTPGSWATGLAPEVGSPCSCSQKPPMPGLRLSFHHCAFLSSRRMRTCLSALPCLPLHLKHLRSLRSGSKPTYLVLVLESRKTPRHRRGERLKK